jgi:hypothetical protein
MNSVLALQAMKADSHQARFPSLSSLWSGICCN